MFASVLCLVGYTTEGLPATVEDLSIWLRTAQEGLQKIKAGGDIDPAVVSETTVAIKALGGAGDRRAVDVLTPFLALPWKTQWEGETPGKLACDALGRIGDTAAVPPLRALMTTVRYGNRKAELYARAATALVRLDKKQATEQLLMDEESIGWAEQEHRILITELLGKTGESNAIPALVRLMSNSSAQIRGKAVNSLAELASAHGKAIAAHLDCNERSIRSMVALALGRSPNASIVLQDEFWNGSERSRLGSIWAVGFARRNEFAKPLMEVLTSDRAPPEIRAAAAWSLGEICHEKSLPLLVEIEKNASGDLKEAADRALGRFDINRSQEVGSVHHEDAAVRMPRFPEKAVCLATKPSEAKARHHALVDVRIIRCDQRTKGLSRPMLYYDERGWEPQRDRRVFWSVDLDNVVPTQGSETATAGLANAKAGWIAVDTWMVVGPFFAGEESTAEPVELPEGEPGKDLVKMDWGAVYLNGKTEQVRWRVIKSNEAWVSLPAHSSRASIYAYTEVYSAKDNTRLCGFGMLGQGKVWINGNLVLVANQLPLDRRLDAFMSPVTFRRGYNSVFLKLENVWLPMDFSLCISAAKQE